MNFKTTYKAVLLAALTATTLASCVKDDLYDTPHPDSGRVTVNADWSARGDGIDVPETWNVSIGDYAGEETEAIHTPDHFFAPGAYTLFAWTPAAGIVVNGSTALATYSREPIGWLFTHTQPIHIERDCNHTFTAAMRQQVHVLTLALDVQGDATDRITGIDADLTGVASSLDFADGTHGSPVTINMTFKKSESPASRSGESNRWVATKRLLGVAGVSQQFTGVIRFANGNPQPLVVSSDLTSDLADFNSGKTVPVTLDGRLVITPTESGVTATIEKWELIDDWNVDAF